MARRTYSRLDALLDAWALWSARVFEGMGGGGASLLARWMDSKGHLIFSGGAPAGRSGYDCVEARIDSTVAQMAVADLLTADVLRLEYAAGWWSVAYRRGLNDYTPHGMGQLQNALALNISLRTYRRRLAQARAAVESALEQRSP